MKNFYEILGIPSDATSREIKKRHRILAKQYHPDTNPNDKTAEENFKNMQAAYDVLSDVEKRRKYDESIATEINKDPLTAYNNYNAGGFSNVSFQFDWKEAVGFILLFIASIFLLVNIFSIDRKD
jgi:curved DNA-binding protein